MTEEKTNIQKAREVMELLPGKNCGKCGFENCGKFAMSVVEGSASPFGCPRRPDAGNEICKVLGRDPSEYARETVGASEGRQGRGMSGHGHGRRGGGFGQNHPGRHDRFARDS